MSNTALKTVAGSAVAVAEKDPATFPGMLVAFKTQIAAALPKHINADRMCRIALTAYRLNPMLAKCQPASVFAAVIQSSQLGLEVGLNGRAYLVPYKKDGGYECQFIPGWRGLVELANRTGRASVWTGAVFEGDDFGYQLGDDPHVTHRPGLEDDPAKLTYVYAVGRVRGNEYPVIEVWSNEKVKKHFKRFNKVGDKHYAYSNWEMYARKVPLLQVLKYMPASPELEAAMTLNEAAENGGQELTIKDVIDGTFAPMPPINADTSGSSTSNEGAKSEAKTSREATAKQALNESGAGAPTYRDVAASINLAQDKDALDAAVDLIGTIGDEKQQVELRDLAGARRLELKLDNK